MLAAIFFFGAAFGISAVSLMELVFLWVRLGRASIRMFVDMICDGAVILIALCALIKMAA